MPVWHADLQQALHANRVVLLGVVQEQHPDRCRLFAQWKQLDWPILHDPINFLSLRGVPGFVAIDEYGIVRAINPKRETFVEEFLNQQFSPPEDPPATTAVPFDLAKLLSLESVTKAEATSEEIRPSFLVDLGREVLLPPYRQKLTEQSIDYETWRTIGDAVILWRPIGEIDAAICAYQQAMQSEPERPEIHFRLGVAYRMRYEANALLVEAGRTSMTRADGSSITTEVPPAGPEDFRRSIEHWSRALELDPNQYIYRRRIQQYGPRLTKPYPFYDWVDQARIAVRERGQVPIPLAMEPRGTERIGPDVPNIASPPAESPDPRGRIDRDRKPLVRVTPTFVPAQVSPGQAVRLHLEFAPIGGAQWNNEAGPMVVWLDLPESWGIETPLLRSSQPSAAESAETRRLETDLQIPADLSGASEISAYALYYVCEMEGGTCRFLRQDIPLVLPLRDVSSR